MDMSSWVAWAVPIALVAIIISAVVWMLWQHADGRASLNAKIDTDELERELLVVTARVFELEARAEQAEKAAHIFVEEVRYTLEAAAAAVSAGNVKNDLSTIAMALPYLYSGRRHWNEKPQLDIALEARLGARMLAREFGFELPTDPVEAVKSMLELSCMLLVPSQTEPVQGLRIRYPVQRV